MVTFTLLKDFQSVRNSDFRESTLKKSTNGKRQTKGRKKMNFTTDLPKSNPMVSYIVASAMKCSRPSPGKTKESPCFRMHAVVLKNKSNFFCEIRPRKSTGTQWGQRINIMPC